MEEKNPQPRPQQRGWSAKPITEPLSGKSIRELKGKLEIYTMGGNGGEILMLEVASDTARPWASASTAETLDALPYINDDNENPKVKEEVDRLVEEEMRRSIKKPTDFLKDLPPLPTFNFQNYPMVGKEFERVREIGLKLLFAP